MWIHVAKRFMRLICLCADNGAFLIIVFFFSRRSRVCSEDNLLTCHVCRVLMQAYTLLMHLSSKWISRGPPAGSELPAFVNLKCLFACTLLGITGLRNVDTRLTKQTKASAWNRMRCKYNFARWQSGALATLRQQTPFLIRLGHTCAKSLVNFMQGPPIRISLATLETHSRLQGIVKTCHGTQR